MWNVLKSTEESDEDTMLFNVSSTASFNCSVMKHQNVSCSVDGVTSVFSICKYQIKTGNIKANTSKYKFLIFKQ